MVMPFDRVEEKLTCARFSPVRQTDATGLVMEAVGLLPIGALCIVERQTEQGIIPVENEVGGLNGQTPFLMPPEHVDGILPGARIYALQSDSHAENCLRGRICWPRADRAGSTAGWPPWRRETRRRGCLPTLNHLHRDPIKNVLDVGVRAINGLLTVGRGQRMGLFAGSGVGKACCSA